MNFYHLFLEASRQGSLPPWMLPCTFNPDKHREIRPWWSFFPAHLRAIYSLWAAEEGGGSSPALWSLVSVAWSQHQGKGNQLLPFLWSAHCTPHLLWAFLGERHFSALSSHLDPPWGCLGLYVPLCGTPSPTAHFYHLRKAWLRSRSALPVAFICWLWHLLYSHVVPWRHCLYSICVCGNRLFTDFKVRKNHFNLPV